MDDAINPYAAPRVEKTVAAPPSSWQGIWRDKQMLVMDNNASLPNYCVKTGESVTLPGVRVKFVWHNPWLALFILFNVLLYLIIALIASKRVSILVPVSETVRENRKTSLALCWAFGLGGFAAFVAGMVMLLNFPNPSPIWLLFLILGLLSFLIALIRGQSKSRIIKPKRITKTHAWFAGVHPSILEQLPQLPAGTVL